MSNLMWGFCLMLLPLLFLRSINGPECRKPTVSVPPKFVTCAVPVTAGGEAGHDGSASSVHTGLMLMQSGVLMFPATPGRRDEFRQLTLDLKCSCYLNVALTLTTASALLQAVNESCYQGDDSVLKSLVEMADTAPKYLRPNLEASLQLCLKVRLRPWWRTCLSLWDLLEAH